MKNSTENRHYEAILQALDTLEGMNGPEHLEYIQVMSTINQEIARRIHNATTWNTEELQEKLEKVSV